MANKRKGTGKGKGKPKAKVKVETKTLKCMKCLQSFTERAWKSHNLSAHNNLSWTEGEPEIDVTDEKLVLTLLQPLYKAKIMYKCEKCKKKLRSAVGFYSHIGICGKDFKDETQFKTQCTLCGKWVLPVSMKAHMAGIHPENGIVEEEHIKEVLVEEETSETFSNKRKSALKALNIIENLNKSQKNDDIADGLENFDENRRKRNMYRLKRNGNVSEYFCKKCTFECKSKEEVIEHFEKKHPDNFNDSDEEFNTETVNGDSMEVEDDDEDDYDDDEYDDEDDDFMDEDYDGEYSTKRGRSNVRVRSNGGDDGDGHHVCLKYNTNYQDFGFAKFLPRYVYDTQKSYQERLDNYSQKLYEEYFVSNYELVTDTDSYLKTKQSANVCFHKSKPVSNAALEWRNLKIFESSVDNDTISIFCGGPIVTADWLPLPLTEQNENQFLALVVQENFVNIKYTPDISNWRNKNECVQLWNFGRLDDDIDVEQIKPTLEYLLVHELGEITHMKWCPSGCYNPPKRLGLLAVATTSGNLFIFCPPLITFTKKLGKKCKFLKMKPYCELDFRVTYGNLPQYATQVAWSQTCGHKLVAGGTSSGLVCIWHVETQSNSLKKFDKQNEWHVLYPIRTIYAHEGYISGLSFNSFNDKIFLTCSKDFFLKFWNIESNQLISALKGDCYTCGYMPANNLTAIVGSEVFGTKTSTNAMLVPFRGLNYKKFYFGKYSSCTWSVSHNNWSYFTLYSSIDGLVSIDNTAPLFLPKRLRTKRGRSVLTACLPHPLNESRPNQCFSYDSFTDNYGLIFYDIPLRKSHPEQQYVMHKENLCLNYSLQSAQFVQWNPNEKSSNFFLVGYQSGIIRLRTLKIKAHTSLFV